MTRATSMGERILLALSRRPGTPDYSDGMPSWSVEGALEPLYQRLPRVRSLVQGADVLDVGCGTGHQAVAFARAGARSVTGLDTNPRMVELARQLATEYGVADRVRFAGELGSDERFDLVLSQDSMEHFTAPAAVLGLLASAVRATGRVVITFGPPWFAPYGAHQFFYTRVPWVHLLFPERTVMRVRSRFRDDGATRYDDVEGRLGRMSIAKFERVVADSGLVVEERRYRCLKGIDVLQHIPALRELLINHVACILRPK